MSEKEQEPREDENKEKQSRMNVSRRGFLKGVGTGAVSVALTGVPLVLPPDAADAAEALAAGVKESTVRLNVNGAAYRVKVKSHWTLLEVLRREMALTGSKKICDRGSCGACTVLMDGKPIYACSRLAIEMDGKTITTIEGLADGETPHPIQSAFMQNDGFQCGFCTSGFIMSTKGLLDKNPRPNSDEIKEALSGNICRCSAYRKILASAKAATQKG